MTWPPDQCSVTSVSVLGTTQLYVLMQFVCLTALFIFQLWLSHTCVAVCLPSADRADLELISSPPNCTLGGPDLGKGSPLAPHKRWPCRGTTDAVISAKNTRSPHPKDGGGGNRSSFGCNYILYFVSLLWDISTVIMWPSKTPYCIIGCRYLNDDTAALSKLIGWTPQRRNVTNVCKISATYFWACYFDNTRSHEQATGMHRILVLYHHHSDVVESEGGSLQARLEQ